MKAELCRAFCDDLKVRDVPLGLAVVTGFDALGGEPLGFYVVGPDHAGLYHLEDDGTTVPLIEAQGADLETQTRSEAVSILLEEYGASLNLDTRELVTGPIAKDKIPLAAMRFIALLLRLQDIILLTPERVASTFKEDAKHAIRHVLEGRAKIEENAPVAPNLDYPADLLLTAEGRDPVAVFLASTEQRVLEAVIAQMESLYEAHSSCQVIALLEKDSSVTQKTRRKASNRLTALPIFEGDQSAAITRIQREVLGPQFTVH